MIAAPVLKTCSCGAAYTYADWLSLRYVGTTYFDDHPPKLQLRDCYRCRSTIGVFLDHGNRPCSEDGARLATEAVL